MTQLGSNPNALLYSNQGPTGQRGRPEATRVRSADKASSPRCQLHAGVRAGWAGAAPRHTCDTAGQVSRQKQGINKNKHTQ